MALLRNRTRMIGCLSGNLLECSATAGSPTVQSSVKRSSSYAYSLAGASTANKVGFYSAAFNARGHYVQIVFVIRFTDVTPSAERKFAAEELISSANTNWELTLDTNGDVKLYDNASNLQATITAPFTANTWHAVKLEFFHNNTSGSMYVTIDGTENGPYSDSWGVNVGGPYLVFTGPAAGDGTIYVDCAVISSDDTTIQPTYVPNDIGIAGPYTTAHATNTDLGDALSTGLWDDVGEIPWGATNHITLENNPHSSGTDADDGTYAGPYGDSELTGVTIHGMGVSAYYSTGGNNYDLVLYWGSNNDTWTSGLQSRAIIRGSGVTLDSFLSWEAIDTPDAPTTSEYFRFGVSHAENKDLAVYEMVGAIIYGPAAVASLPPFNPIHRLLPQLVR